MNALRSRMLSACGERPQEDLDRVRAPPLEQRGHDRRELRVRDALGQLPQHLARQRAPDA